MAKKRKVTIIYHGVKKVEKPTIKEGAKYLIEELINKEGINDITGFKNFFKNNKIKTNKELVISPEEYVKEKAKFDAGLDRNKRYFDEPIKIGGSEYYLSSQWGGSKSNITFSPLKDLAERELGCKIEVEGTEAKSSNSTPSKSTASENSKPYPIIDVIGEVFNQSEKKQLILTGAPGTGKTYAAREYAIDNGENHEFVQFHPSYDYTDFVEGLRPIASGSGIDFVKMDGRFKAFCREVVEANNKKKSEMGRDTCDEDEDDDIELDKYFFIIDEINRADLSKVFGELMYGLEYREAKIVTQYQNLPTYDRSGKEIVADVFKDGFFIPSNLYIIGTMNDIDRSVESFDFALRRRFDWVEIRANDVMEDVINRMLDPETVNHKDIERITSMNNKISGLGSTYGLSDAYHIGPAYFKGFDPQNPKDSLKKIFDHNIAPILREYTRGRDRERVEEFVDECSKALLG